MQVHPEPLDAVLHFTALTVGLTLCLTKTTGTTKPVAALRGFTHVRFRTCKPPLTDSAIRYGFKRGIGLNISLTRRPLLHHD